MPSVVEEYAYESQHLDEKDALERYRSLKVADPDALIVLKDFSCGHWEVKSLQTDVEKEDYFRELLAGYATRVFARFTKRR